MNLILLGKSAAGKDTMAKLLSDNFRYQRVVSATTRPKRKDEVEGKDYYFLTNDEFNSLRDEDKFVETTEYRGWHYGTLKSEFEKENGIFVLNPMGYRQLLNTNLAFISIYIDTFDKYRYIRQLNRGDNIIEIALRSERDTACFQGLENEVDIVVDNDTEEWDCVNEILFKVAQIESEL